MENMDVIDAIVVEYTYGSPTFAITDVRHRELLDLKKLKGGENFPEIRKNYLNKLIHTLINAYKNQELDVIFNHLKRSSSVTYILSEFMSFISSELKETDKLKPPILLKVLNCLFLNDDLSARKELCAYTYSLEIFLTTSLKTCGLNYLLRDIAADFLSELCCISANDELKDAAVLQLSRAFRFPQDYLEDLKDLYGATVGCLSNMTTEIGAKVVHYDAFYNMVFAERVVNSPKTFNKLVCVCEPYIYCCLPNEIVDVSVIERSSLYNLNIANIYLYNLIRNEVLHAPFSLVKYKHRTSKPFQFSDLLFDVTKVKKLLNKASENICQTDISRIPVEDCRSIDLRNITPEKLDMEVEKICQTVTCKTQDACCIQNVTAKESCACEQPSTNMEDNTFWDYCNIFSIIETAIDFQLVFFGYLSVENTSFDIYSCESEKASLCHVSSHLSSLVSASLDYEEPFNLNLRDLDFKVWENNITARKSSKKRRLSPPSK